MSENLIANHGRNVKLKEETAKFYFGWSAGSFDDRAKNNKSICSNFKRSNVSLDSKRSCTGDPAKELEMSFVSNADHDDEH
jgi:hypothetical protein